MVSKEWFSPFEESRRVGSVISVTPTEVMANLTLAGLGEAKWLFGEKIPAGEVNEYIFIHIGSSAVFGRITKVWLDGGERLTVDSVLNPAFPNHPIGAVQLLASINSETGRISRGITTHPRLGSQIYSAHPKLVATLISGLQDLAPTDIIIPIATSTHDESIIIHSTPEKMFSRHCAILGTTGGGKSFTTASLLQQVQLAGGRAILIDATGEYSTLDCHSFYVGPHALATDATAVTFPHWQFSDTDIRAFLRPSPQSQGPKLEAAIQSLKIRGLYQAQLGHGLNFSGPGCILKNGELKAHFENCLLATSHLLGQAQWSFRYLSEQIIHECVWPEARGDVTRWGLRADNDVGHCLNLISRIKSYASNPHLNWMIDPPGHLQTIPALIDSFLNTAPRGTILRLDLSAVAFEANSREILVNAIGRKLLANAREGSISHANPILVFIDESHQFLNKSVGEDSTKISLDAFGNIAKEGRKYGLNVVIATQRPRDIPEDVLSQIGTLIVHRLTNQLDQDLIKRAVGDMDQRSASFLPSLAQGEALLLGVDFPFPAIVKILKPARIPSSRGPNYSSSWRIPPPLPPLPQILPNPEPEPWADLV
ncbi:ATP-binding protein [Pseudomonas proteolytica]|uniref:ATP-binding protein n=1 Tax=Pseudomonas proteolytica TaxID=219574 RepID=UPI0030DCFDB6